MEMGQFDGYRNMVSTLSDGAAPTVLFGIEADYYEGGESFLRRWLPHQGFDFVLGSVHYIDGWGFDNPVQRHVWESVDVKGAWKRYFQLIVRLVDLGLFDAVGHLDIAKKFGHRPADADLLEMVQPVLDRIAAAGMGLDVNTAGLRRPVGEIYPSPLILSLAQERGIPICFGSDAHRPEEVGYAFRTAIEVAKQSGYTQYFGMKGRKMSFLPLPA
jgi:histidinol-phosphatase (PHP family)